jgi:hypothetical protein
MTDSLRAFIKKSVAFSGYSIMTAGGLIAGNTGVYIAKDPYFAFMLKDGNPGDKITISWIDNLGSRDSQDHTLQ